MNEKIVDGNAVYRLRPDGAGYEFSRLTDNNICRFTIPYTFRGLPVTSIGEEAFYNCAKLGYVHIPQSVTEIGALAFGDAALESVEIPASAVKIGHYAFDNCKFKSVFVPASVKEIGDNPFSACSALESIAVSGDNANFVSSGNCLIERKSGKLVSGCRKSAIPADGSVKVIGDSAFDGCLGLEGIEIPASVKAFDENIFDCCDNLKLIIFAGTLKEWDNIRKEMRWSEGMPDLTLRCTDGERKLKGFVE